MGDTPAAPEPDGDGPIGVAALAEAVDEMLAVAGEAWRLTESELVKGIAALEAQAARLDAARLAFTAEVDRRGMAAGGSGATGTAAWLRGLLRLTPGEATGRVSLGSWLDGEGAVTKTALSDGALSARHASVICRTMARLHPAVDPETRAEAQGVLVDQARRLDPDQLARAARYLRHRLDPESGERLAREEDRQAERCDFTVSLDSDGGSHLRGYLDPVSTATLLSGLDPLSAPRPAAEGGYDTRSPGLRRAQALIQLVERAMAIPPDGPGALPSQRGARPRMVVTVPLATLLAELGIPALDQDGQTGVEPAVLATGQVVSARTAQQLACEAEILPVLLDEHGNPLDVGRTVYPFPDRIRRAIETRDQHCTFPHCQAPATWCHVHHLVPFSEGGSTSVTNGALVCGRHHRQVHSRGWWVK